MLGAILGDIVGSRFEFDEHKSREFALFGGDGLHQGECFFTDDTVMTVAVAEALFMMGEVHTEDDKWCREFKNRLCSTMHAYGAEYPYAGYGGRFYYWLRDQKTEGYNSYGNGSAMRVSPVGWAASSMEEAMELAKLSAEISHNHPEGIKGAQAAAAGIFLARQGKSKEEIGAYLSSHFYPEIPHMSVDSIRPDYMFNETCQETVPQAIVAFLESESFEDAVRNAVSLGGDCDTLTCICCAIAEAYYGIPEEMKAAAMGFLDETLAAVTEEFCQKYCQR